MVNGNMYIIINTGIVIVGKFWTNAIEDINDIDDTIKAFEKLNGNKLRQITDIRSGIATMWGRFDNLSKSV